MKDIQREEHPLDQFLVPERRQRLEQVLQDRSDSLTIVLDQVQNYHNISAVLRSADAFGIKTVHLIGDSFEYSRTISLGAENWVVLKRYKSGSEAAQQLRAAGYKLAVLRPRREEDSAETNIPVYELPFDQKLALIFGNERNGVSPELDAAADLAAHIPMYGFVESLNVSVACAIALFSSSIGKADGVRRLAPILEGEKSDLRDRWLRKSVRNSEAILREIEKRGDG